MKKIKNYEDLLVWQKADELALAVYAVTNNFPREELFGLTSQLKRSILSVPANIVEGFVRHSTKEYIQFLYIALSSLAESEYYIKFSCKNKFLSVEHSQKLLNNMNELGKMLRGLIKSLSTKS